MSILSAFAFERVEVGSKPVGLSPSIFKDAEKAFLTFEGECRWTYHSEGEPSSTEGHLMRDGGFIILKGELQIKNFRAIATGSETATIQVSYERA